MDKARMNELLDEAAKAFREQTDPFSTEWLIKNEVTADECFALSDWIADCIENRNLIIDFLEMLASKRRGQK